MIKNYKLEIAYSVVLITVYITTYFIAKYS